MKSGKVDVLLNDVKRWSQSRPTAGVVAGILDIDFRNKTGDDMHVHVEAEGFTPVHWVALADQSLFWAIERMRASTKPPIELIAQCEAARAALGLEEPAPN